MPGIYDVSLDACKANTVFQNPVFTTLLPKVKEIFGNVLKDCPYHGDHKIPLKIDTSNFPPVGPSGYNRVDVTIFVNKTRWFFKMSIFTITRNENWWKF
jgi:hypothetical protein